MTTTADRYERNWGVRDAIVERVRREDLLRWASRPDPPFEIVPTDPAPPISNKELLRHFVRQLIA